MSGRFCRPRVAPENGWTRTWVDGIRNLWRLVGAAVIHQNDFVIHTDVPKHFAADS